MTCVIDFWQTRAAWPKDRSGQYVFLLDALCQFGEAKSKPAATKSPKSTPAPWTPTARVLWPSFGSGLPDYATTDANNKPPAVRAEMDRFLETHRERAHWALMWSDVNYWPASEPISEWRDDVSLYAPSIFSQPVFSEDQWRQADEILSLPPVTPDEYKRAFKYIEHLADAFATGKLETFAQRVDGGVFTPIAREGWFVSSDNPLKARFAFGQIDESAIALDITKSFSTSPRGAHWIFVEKLRLPEILATCDEQLSGFERAQLWITTEEAKTLHDLGCRKDELIFEMMRKFNLTKTNATSAWSASAPQSFRDGGSPTAEQKEFTRLRYKDHFKEFPWLENAPSRGRAGS